MANVAQNFAVNCRDGNNPDRVNQQSTFTTVGENIGILGARDFTQIIQQQWFGVSVNYNYDTQSCLGNCNAYTQVRGSICFEIIIILLLHSDLCRLQLVNAETIAVGCGSVPCGGGTSYLLVCNYGPGQVFR